MLNWIDNIKNNQNQLILIAKRRSDYNPEEINVYSIEDYSEDYSKINLRKIISSEIRGLKISGPRGLVILSLKNKFQLCSINFSHEANDCVAIILPSKFNQKFLIELNKENSSVFISEDFSSNGVRITSYEGKGIYIGKDNMWAAQIVCMNSDAHAIIDVFGNVINKSQDIFIGEHVWIAFRAQILKGVTIGPNSVVGADAFITKSFEEGNQILAGLPAKVVKSNINWDRRSVSLYEKMRNNNIIREKND